jgi:Transglutaminase-like superfamily
MRRLRKFMRLPAAERRLLMKTILLLWVVKVGLVTLPFRTLRRQLGHLAVSPVDLRDAEDPRSIERVVWAVELSGRLMPHASTCLTQALTAQVLLSRRGHPALVHIGTLKGKRGELQAHAWVESGGEVVIGGHELEQYTRLAILEGARQ